MINIAQSSPAVWSPPASAATPPVAPVTPVTAARPLQESARDGQSGADAERDARAARADRAADAREAREARRAAGEGERRGAGRSGAEPVQGNDALARRENEENAKQQADRQAADEARRSQRQELLTNLWDASAAVVNRALGREGTKETVAVDPVAPSQAPAELAPLEPLPWPVMPPEASASPAPANDFPQPQEVVSYDEHGNGSTAPVEPGSLVSERV